MAAFAAARRLMVDGQLRINDLTNPRLLGAVQSIAREKFVPAEKAELAYVDFDLPLTEASPDRPQRFLLKPLILGKLIEIADIGPDDRVLDVGCATGYSSAILAGLAREVVALEEDSELAAAAVANCAEAGKSNVTVRTGPLAAGAPDDAPFNVILIGGGVEFVPQALTAQLAEAGRLACILRQGRAGKGMLYLAASGTLSGRSVFDGAAPLLPGFINPPAFAF